MSNWHCSWCGCAWPRGTTHNCTAPVSDGLCRCRHPRHVQIDEPGNGRYTVCQTCHGQVCDE